MIIHAAAHSDDYVVVVNFDATPWFQIATDEQLLALLRCGRQGDYPADAVAMHCRDHCVDVQRLFDYIERVSGGYATVGFECSVNLDEAKAWIKRNRPAMHLKLSAEEGQDMTLKKIELPSFGITLVQSDAYAPAWAITSDLRSLTDNPAYDAAITTLEEMILSHVCAGIDVQAPAYLEGIERTVNTIFDKYANA